MVMNPLLCVDLDTAQMYSCSRKHLTTGNASEMDSGQPKAHEQMGNITMCPSELGASSLVGASDPGNLH